MCVWEACLRFPNARFAFSVLFFLHAFERPTRLLFMNRSRKVWLFPPFQHKFHFLATFSLKMGFTVLFTYLKIILLQCFSVFNFQFSAERTLNLGVSMFVPLIIRFVVFFIVHNWYSDWIFKIFRLSEMIFCIVLIMTRIYHFS